ncbi:unnamed protein product, partial [Polarella glacialis]
VVRYRGGGVLGSSVENHVIREAEALALTRHPNVLRFHHAWIEVDSPSTPRRDRGDASSSSQSPSWPSTPFAPPPSPSVQPRMPPLMLPPTGPSQIFLEDLTERSGLSYDGGSCGSGVVYFEWNEQELEAPLGSTSPTSASPVTPRRPEG